MTVGPILAYGATKMRVLVDEIRSCDPEDERIVELANAVYDVEHHLRIEHRHEATNEQWAPVIEQLRVLNAAIVASNRVGNLRRAVRAVEQLEADAREAAEMCSRWWT